MRAADIRPGVEYAIVRYKRDRVLRRAVLETKSQGGAYKLITRELVDGVGKDVEPRVEWTPAPHDTRSHTFRLVEPRKQFMRRGYHGPDEIEYLAEFMAVRGQEVLGPYDEVVAERERREQARREADERRRAATRANAALTETLGERLDSMGLADVFEVVDQAHFEPPKLRCRMTAEQALDALDGWRS